MRQTPDIEELYRRHGAALVLFATSFTGDRSRGQDAVHHVFAKLIETGDLARAADKKAYLFASVRNAVLNEVKVQRRSVSLEPECAWFDPPERDYAAEERLRRVLSELPEEQREITILHIWGDLTFSQVAEVLKINANTAASRYRYALEKLREVMCPKEETYGKR